MIGLIIPMYNSEKTIQKTLQSVVNQTVAFSEVIVVDNGSSDQSLAIVSEICQQYPYIRVLTCEQKGVSSARNKGIDASQSPYIGFLDADDILDPSYVEVLTKTIVEHPNTEMYHFNFYQQFKSGIIKQNPYFLHDNEMYTGQEFMEKTYRLFSFEAKHMVWTFIFKKEFLNQYHLRFNTEMTIFEDILFLNNAWNHSTKIYIVNTKLVYYLYNLYSMTTQSKEEITCRSLKVLKDEKINQQYLLKLSSRILNQKNFLQLWNDIYFKKIRFIFLKIAYLLSKLKSK